MFANVVDPVGAGFVASLARPGGNVTGFASYMPMILGQLRVLPKHWWEGSDASGKRRDIGATTLEPPLGNGAYRIKEFVPGRSVIYGRVKDYWATV